MRGRVDGQQSMFVAFDLEQFVPDNHPLRKIKRWADGVLAGISRDFDRAYGRAGRPGVPPERLLRALLLQALCSIPSETKLVDAIQYNLLYRWFLDLPLEENSWTQEAFSMNRQRFELHDLCRKFFNRVVAEGVEHGLISADQLTADGTLIRSLASQKSLKRIDDADDDDDQTPQGRDTLVDFRGQKRSNATQRSSTNPEARLARKGLGKESHLCQSGHVLMDNRSCLCLALTVDSADGHAERRNAMRMLRHRSGVGTDWCRGRWALTVGTAPVHSWSRSRNTEALLMCRWGLKRSAATPSRHAPVVAPEDACRPSATRSASGCANASSRSSGGARPPQAWPGRASWVTCGSRTQR